jgi:hypothetical protein
MKSSGPNRSAGVDHSPRHSRSSSRLPSSITGDGCTYSRHGSSRSAANAEESGPSAQNGMIAGRPGAAGRIDGGGAGPDDPVGHLDELRRDLGQRL